MLGSGYSYFSGANVIIEVEGVPLLEAVGIRMNEMESKRPIYGYSSRHFDAMASGQVLVEGALLINFVDHNYLFRAIELGLRETGQLRTDDPPPAIDHTSELRDQLANEGNTQSLLNQLQLDPTNNPGIASAMKGKYWLPNPETATKVPTFLPSPHDSFGGLDITVTWGDRETYNFYRGQTSRIIKSVYFVGRGQQIAIDADVIVEEYPFIARQIVHEVNPYKLAFTDTGQSTGEQEFAIH